MQPESFIALFTQELQLLSLKSLRCLRHQSPNSILSNTFASYAISLALRPISKSHSKQCWLFYFIFPGIFGNFLVFFRCLVSRSRESNHIASQGEPSHRVTLSSVSKFFSYLRAASSKIWWNQSVHLKLWIGGESVHVIFSSVSDRSSLSSTLHLVEDCELFRSHVWSEVLELSGSMCIHMSICLGAFYFPCKFPPVNVNVSRILLLCAFTTTLSLTSV